MRLDLGKSLIAMPQRAAI